MNYRLLVCSILLVFIVSCKSPVYFDKFEKLDRNVYLITALSLVETQYLEGYEAQYEFDYDNSKYTKQIQEMYSTQELPSLQKLDYEAYTILKGSIGSYQLKKITLKDNGVNLSPNDSSIIINIDKPGIYYIGRIENYCDLHKNNDYLFHIVRDKFEDDKYFINQLFRNKEPIVKKIIPYSPSNLLKLDTIKAIINANEAKFDSIYNNAKIGKDGKRRDSLGNVINPKYKPRR